MLLEMDDYYRDQIGPGGIRVATQLAKQLAQPAPFDLSEIDLAHYRGLTSRWQEWSEVAAFCRQLAVMMLAAGAEGSP